MQPPGLPCPGEYLRLCPLRHNRCTETKKYGPNKRSKLQKKLSDEEIANLSYTQFKTLAIRMLTEMVEYGHKLEEKMKAMKSEIKQNIKRTNSEGKETGTQIKNSKK